MSGDQSKNQEFSNLYEVVKTVRFGLSPNLSKGKKDQVVFKTHQNLIEEVKKTHNDLQNEKEGKELKLSESDLIKKIRIYIYYNKIQLKLWNEVCLRSDLIGVDKEYYRVLEKKAKFNGFWYRRDKQGMEVKEPCTKLIKLSSLQKTYLNKEIKYFIIDYWHKISQKNYKLIENSEQLLKKFESYLEDATKSHKKPNLVDFRKQFLSILNVSNEWLIPIKNQSLIINSNNLNENKHNQSAIDFNNSENLQNRIDLYNIGQGIKEYFELNGSQIPFGKVTLNYWTARQKPENFGEKIDELIKILEVEKLYEKYKDFEIDEIKTKILNQSNKYEVFLGRQNSDLIKIEIAQLFKPKPIPASVKFSLTERLSENKKYDHKKLIYIFDEIGKSIDVGEDYYKCLNEDKEDPEKFDLNKYPLKLAFDYAWENLARWETDNSKNKFPRKSCEIFLEDYFIDKDQKKEKKNRENFKLYAKLLFIGDKLANLEHSAYEIKDLNTLTGIVNGIYRKLDESKNSIDTNCKVQIKENNKFVNKSCCEIIKNQEIIKYIYENQENLNFQLIREKVKNYKWEKDWVYQKAKQHLGLLRGKQKNNVTKYEKLTEEFKGIAIDLGKNFAELRDKLREENQFTKITHYGVVVENNQDKYLLALPLLKKINPSQTEIDDKLDILKNNFTEQKTDYVVRELSSFTSKTLNKILKNVGGYTEFHFTKEELERCNNYEGLKNLYPKKVNLLKKFKKNCHLKDVENKKRDTNLREQLINHVKNCLLGSPMATSQNWQKFNWAEELNNCKTYEDIGRVLDLKGYKLEKKHIQKTAVQKLVENDDCLLLPIINQDVQNRANETRSRFENNQNQFTTDIEKALSEENGYRLHPEISLFYRFPTNKPKNGKSDEDWENLRKEHHAQILNRNSRFQIIGNFGIEIKPYTLKFENKKDQLKLWNSQEKLKEYIDLFNQKIQQKFNKLDEYYIFGIDRGIKQLATLCVTDKSDSIQEFDIYTREFDRDEKKKIWVHKFLEKRACLDLSNLRVETKVDSGEKVLVDLAEIPVWDKIGETKKENVQKIKLKQAAYIRKMQYLMSSDRPNLMSYIRTNRSLDNLECDIKSKVLFSPFKEGENYANLPIDKLKDLLDKFYKLNDKEESLKLTQLEKDLLKQETEELDPTDELKRGIVANMVGVVAYLIEKHEYKVLIALENLNRSFYSQKDGLTEEELDRRMNYKEMENRILCGVGTYQFFETQLLRKLSRIQKGNSVLSLVPTFRSKENYEEITKVKITNKPVNKQFGSVFFVDPRFTSSKCPICDNTKTKEAKSGEKIINRNTKKSNIFSCQKCGFVSVRKLNQFENIKNLDNSEYQYSEEEIKKIIEINNQAIKNYNQNDSIKLIENGDQNGAYNIGRKLHK